MNVATFQARCKDCGNEFPFPLLSDAAYGEFVAVGDDGATFGYLNSFDHSAWQRIEFLVSKHAGLAYRLRIRGGMLGRLFPWREAVTLFQWLIGRCLDPINGATLSIVRGPVCARCRSSNVEYGDAERLGTVELPAVTFSAFDSMSPGAQSVQIARLIAEYRSSKRSSGA